METQWGLAQVWAQGDGVSKSILLVLLAMSIASWLVIVLRSLSIWRGKRQAAQTKGFWEYAEFSEALASLEQGRHANPFLLLAQAGQEAHAHHQQHEVHLRDAFNRSDWISRSLQASMDEAQARLQGGLTVLASVGSTAPFVGLFGTVWGIYHALTAIGISGQVGIDRVAGPVGEALIMTALGLAVAIPAVLAYNALVRGNKHLLLAMNRFAHDLHTYLLTGSRLPRVDAPRKAQA